MALSALQERLNRTKRTQARALAGERVSETVVVEPSPAAAANEDSHFTSALAEFDRDGLLAEFDDLLPVMASHFGYSQADQDFVRSAATSGTPMGNAELIQCVRQWRIDAVSHMLLEQLPGGVAERAWTQFRMGVMGKSINEAGVPYSQDSLERPVEVAVSESVEKKRSPRP